MSLKVGQMNNCEKCGASYSTYNVKTEMKDDWKEKWCEIPISNLKPKGLCQFCNPKSIFYNED